MIFESVVSEGLAHISYLLGDEDAGVACVIDPRRDVDIYIDLARRHHVRIAYILETHIHADFVSGSPELAQRTGAPVCVGRSDDGYGFEHRDLDDGDEIEIGSYTLKVLHTPGHTPEHVCFLVSGGAGAESPWGLFSGDTLFAGEVGRPDLLGEGSEKPLARRLFHSLHEKILSLCDDIVVYPAHGEGSPCGASIGDRSTTTIGYEKQNNPLLKIDTEEGFVETILESQSPAPAYYPRMKKINAEGAEPLGPLPYLPPLTPDDVEERMKDEGCVIVDCREIEAFAAAHIEDGLSIPLRDSFPVWAGRILDPESELILVLSDSGDGETVQRHLLRVGLESISGTMAGIRPWFEAGKCLSRSGLMSVHELHQSIEQKEDLQVVDVRGEDEWESGHIPTAQHIFLPELEERLDELDRNRPVAVYCGSGYRASIGVSLLRRAGFADVSNVAGSIGAWNEVGYPLENPD